MLGTWMKEKNSFGRALLSVYSSPGCTIGMNHWLLLLALLLPSFSDITTVCAYICYIFILPLSKQNGFWFQCAFKHNFTDWCVPHQFSTEFLVFNSYSIFFHFAYTRFLYSWFGMEKNQLSSSSEVGHSQKSGSSFVLLSFTTKEKKKKKRGRWLLNLYCGRFLISKFLSTEIR